jgi:hypothetical protein
MVKRPAANASINATTSGFEATNRNPFFLRITAAATKAVRLLPSKKGLLRRKGC